MDANDICLLWVWLSLKYKPGTTRISDLLEVYGDVETIYEEEKYDDVRLPYNELKALRDKRLDAAYDIVDKVYKANAKILVYDDERYPDNLRHMADPPYVLYTKGDIIDWNKFLLISIVGKRECTEYGIAATRKIAGELAQKGIVIVSGLAMGLDAAATIEALRHNRYSVGVLGCPIDKVYPKNNQILYDAVEKTGILMSEYPPGSNPGKMGFPMRNRIIAGLSSGLVVTEAGRKSGTRITVEYAYDYSRNVFAVPGSIFSESSEGTNRLLMGSAKAVISAEDIISEYPYAENMLKAPMGNIYIKELPEIEKLIGSGNIQEKKQYSHSVIYNKGPARNKKIIRNPDKKSEENTASEEAKDKAQEINLDEFEGVDKEIIKMLLSGEKEKDVLIREIDADAGRVSTALTLLEMDKVIKQYPGNIYKLK